MQKAEIIKILREKISKKYTQPIVIRAVPDIINALFSIMKEELKKGEGLKIAGLGIFSVKEITKEETKETKRIIRFIPSKK